MAQVVDKSSPVANPKVVNKNGRGKTIPVDRTGRGRAESVGLVGDPDWDLQDWDSVDFDVSPQNGPKVVT